MQVTVIDLHGDTFGKRDMKESFLTPTEKKMSVYLQGGLREPETQEEAEAQTDPPPLIVLILMERFNLMDHPVYNTLKDQEQNNVR